MLFRVYFPPKFLTKILGFVAHAFQIIEVLRGDLLKGFPHPAHGYRRQAIAQTPRIDALAEIFHEFPTLRLPLRAHGAFYVSAYVLHPVRDRKRFKRFFI